MSVATLIFSNWSWLWFAATVTGIALATLLWSYLGAPRGGVRWICVGLKLLGFAALALCLLEPLWSGQRVKPGANLFAVVVDNSQGLQIHDRGVTRTRGEILRELVTARRGHWQESLEDNFEVRRYLFDARLQPTKDFLELDFNGRASRIGSALRTL